MEIVTTEKNSAIILKLSGRLDAAATDHFKAQIMSHVARGKTKLVIDMADVGFIDSSGLGSLVAVLGSLKNTRGDLILTAMSPAIRSVFELTRLDRIFTIMDHTDTAVKAF